MRVKTIATVFADHSQYGSLNCDRECLENLDDVSLVPAQGGWSSGVLNEKGRFLLTNLAPGMYQLKVLEYPQLGRELARREIEVKAANISGLVITVPRR